jgi:hypothetical protein
MKMENKKPEIGPSGRTLGVRTPPNENADIEPDLNGIVHPGTGGMSASPNSPMNLPVSKRPPELGGKGKDPIWCISSCNLGPGLTYTPDTTKPGHGFIEPSTPMPISKYQQLLEGTQKQWKLFKVK